MENLDTAPIPIQSGPVEPQPVQTPTQPPIKSSFKWKWPLVIAVIVVIAILLPAGTYFFLNSNKQVACTLEAKICPDGSSVGRTGPKCEFAPCPKVNPTSTPDPTANWKTYINTKYNFSFKYPSNLKVVLPSPDDYEFAPDKQDMLIPEKTRDIRLVNSNNEPVFSLNILLDSNRTIDQIKQNPLQEPSTKINNLSDAFIGNLPAIKYQIEGSETLEFQTVYNNNDYLFELSNDDYAQQILQTFKFNDQASQTDPTASWKTFTNGDTDSSFGEMGFSIKYPNLYTATDGLDVLKKHPEVQIGIPYYFMEISQSDSSNDFFLIRATPNSGNSLKDDISKGIIFSDKVINGIAMKQYKNNKNIPGIVNCSAYGYVVEHNNLYFNLFTCSKNASLFEQMLSTFKFVNQGSTSPTPTCRPRPACLDGNPRCLLPETSDMCPPKVTPSS